MDENNHKTILMEELDKLKIIVSGDETASVGQRTTRIYMLALKEYSMDEVRGGIELALRTWKKPVMPMPAEIEVFIKRFRGDEIRKHMSKTGRTGTRCDYVRAGFGTPAIHRLISMKPFFSWIIDYRLIHGTPEQKEADTRTFVSMMGFYNDILKAGIDDDHESLQSAFVRLWKFCEVIQGWCEKRFNGLASPDYQKLIQSWVMAFYLSRHTETAIFCDLCHLDMQLCQQWAQGIRNSHFDWSGLDQLFEDCKRFPASPCLIEEDVVLDSGTMKRIQEVRRQWVRSNQEHQDLA